MVHGQHPNVVPPPGLQDVGRQQIRRDAHILHHGAQPLPRPRLPGGLHPGQGLGLGADPGVVEVKPVGPPPEMQVDGRPVRQLGVVQAYRAAPAVQLRQRPVGGLDLLIVGDGDLLEARPQAHPLGQEVPVLLRVVHPFPVLVLNLLEEMGQVGQGRVGHKPVALVMDLVAAPQAADEGQEPVVRLAVEQDPAAPGQVVVQGTVADLPVGGEDPHPGLGHLALAGDKHLDVVVVLKGVDLVEHHLAGAHAVPALGVVGPAPHDALVPPALDELLGVVVVAAELGLIPGALQHLRQILHRRHRLLLVIGADIHVVVAHRVVGGDGAGPVEGDEAVLAGAAAHHAQQGLPPGRPVRPVGAVPQGEEELLPGEQPVVGEVFDQPQVAAQLVQIHADVLLGKYPAHIGGQGVLLRAGPGPVALHALQVPLHLRRDATAHRRQTRSGRRGPPPA